jgi:acetyltransferase
MPTLDEVFCPRGVAVVGASPRNLSFAELVVHSLKEAKFPAVFPVKSKYKEVLGLPCYASLTDIPGAVDHVIVSIPAGSVLKPLGDCRHLWKRASRSSIPCASWPGHGSGHRLERILS